MLNTYLPRARNKTGVNLLSTEGEQRAAREQHALEAGRPREVISMLKPNVTIALVDDFNVYPADKIPEPVRAPECTSCAVACCPFHFLLLRYCDSYHVRYRGSQHAGL